MLDNSTCSEDRYKTDKYYSSNRTPSYCDRILYKGVIKLLDYNLYSNKLISKSDHNMVYGKFNYNNENGIIFTWNMGGNWNDEKIIREGIEDIYKNIISDDKYEYVIFSLQESHYNDPIIPELLEFFKNKNYKLICVSSNSLNPSFIVRLFIFSYEYGVDISENSKCNSISGDNISVQKYHFNIIGTKSYVLISINDLTIVSTHLPINTKMKDYGLNKRVLALKKIIKDVKKFDNVIISGDLNFRIVDGVEQLIYLMKTDNDFKDYKEEKLFNIKTCKMKTCK
jgi:hypothetical protein